MIVKNLYPDKNISFIYKSICYPEYMYNDDYWGIIGAENNKENAYQ